MIGAKHIRLKSLTATKRLKGKERMSVFSELQTGTWVIQPDETRVTIMGRAIKEQLKNIVDESQQKPRSRTECMTGLRK